MNWTERIQNIYSTLRAIGHHALIGQLTSDFGIGGTPGEHFSKVCVWLAKMRNHKQDIYKLVKEDGDAILNEGVSLNYFTEAYYNGL